MPKFRITFLGYASDASDEEPLQQKLEFEHAPIIPRVGEIVSTDFGSSKSDGDWRVREIKHVFVDSNQLGLYIILDAIP